MKQDQNIITEKNKGEEAAELRKKELEQVTGGMNPPGLVDAGLPRDVSVDLNGAGAYGDRTKRRD